MPRTDVSRITKRHSVRFAFGVAASVAFYVVNALLGVAIFGSGFHQFFWLGTFVNGLILLWIVLAPLASFIGWRTKRYLPLAVSATVIAVYLLFGAGLISTKMVWRWILPVAISVFCVVPFFDMAHLRGSVKRLGCDKHAELPPADHGESN